MCTKSPVATATMSTQENQREPWCMAEHKWAVQKSDHNNGIAVHVAKSHRSIDWVQARLVRSGQGYWEKGLTMETMENKRNKGLRFSSV